MIHGRITSALGLSLLAFLFVGCNQPEQNLNPSTTEVSNKVAPPAGTPRPSSTPSNTPTPTATPSGTVPALARSLGINTSIDLRQFDGPVMEQFGGTCSTFGTAAAMNNMLHQKGYNKLVSERHLWSLYGVYDMDAAVDAASSNYVTEEQYWPVNGTRASNYLSFAGLRITRTTPHEYDWQAALQGLSKGHPMVMAIQTPADLGNCKANISATSAATSGQHVIAAVGYKLDDSVAGGGYFIVKNSWGTSCGDKGYHYFPFQLCKRSDLYCYFTEIEDVESKD